MNLWIFNHYAVGADDVGVTRHYDLAKNLVKRGHEVTIFSSSFNHWTKKENIDYKDKENYRIEMQEGVKFVWFKTTRYHNNSIHRILNIFSFYFVVRKFNFNLLNSKPDFVMGSILHHLSAILALKVSKKYKAKFIFEERDLWPQTLIDLGKLSKYHPVIKFLDYFETYMYKKAHKIIVLFDKANIYVRSKNISNNKIKYLPNGTDLNRFNNTEAVQFLDSEKLIKDKKIIAYIGSLSLANNMDRIIEFAKILSTQKEYLFIFIGEGTYKDILIKQAKDSGLNNCLFYPAVNKELIPSILKYADFGIISLKDSAVYKWGYSLNKIYDYLGAGLPIIFDTNVSNNLIKDHYLGITSNNLEELALKLVNLSDEEQILIKKNSRKYVEENHCWENLSYKFEKEIFVD